MVCELAFSWCAGNYIFLDASKVSRSFKARMTTKSTLTNNEAAVSIKSLPYCDSDFKKPCLSVEAAATAALCPPCSQTCEACH